MESPNLTDIDRRARAYADARESLAALVAELTGAIESMIRQALP